jgi:hypothetical protein
MSVGTVCIPQADVLWDVALVPEAVLRGRDTHDAIADYIGAKGQRQGLYYTAQRRARTAAAWLVAAGLALWRDGRLHYRTLPPPAAGFLRSAL